MMQRVINFDWLEVFCYEQVPLEPAYFEQHGYVVKVRDYGTPIYRQMFSVCAWDTEFPMFEIRRDPYSVHSKGGIMQDGACHLRVTNPFCYVPGIVDKFIEFMAAHRLQFVSISRVDVCCDFECFDDGVSVEQFLSDYICERFYKENRPVCMLFVTHSVPRFSRIRLTGLTRRVVVFGTPFHGALTSRSSRHGFITRV